MTNRCLLLLAAAFALASTALAHDYIQGDIHIIKPWSRPLPAISANGAAYMTLVNKGTAPDRLLSVSTPAARKAEIHIHTMEGGMMKMRPMDHIDIEPGEPSVLQPGGTHVMLIGLKEPLVEGKSFPPDAQLRTRRRCRGDSNNRRARWNAPRHEARTKEGRRLMPANGLGLDAHCRARAASRL